VNVLSTTYLHPLVCRDEHQGVNEGLSEGIPSSNSASKNAHFGRPRHPVDEVMEKRGDGKARG